MRTNKNIYRAILLLSFLGLNAGILFGISSVWSYLNTGADRSKRLHVQETLDANYLPKITWGDSVNEGRPMEDQTLRDIERDYLKAWHVRNSAYTSNTTIGIADYYTDSARVKLYDIISLNEAKGTTIQMTTIAHHPTIKFYSEDGQIVVFTDANVISNAEVYLDEKHIATQKDTTSYQVMMLLEDGFWRIRHQVKVASKSNAPIQGKIITEDISKQVSGLKGINYYPQKTPWNLFGGEFDESIVAKDFELIHTMGLNTIRVFVPYLEFGKASIDKERLEQLRLTLDLAQKLELKVVVTLFDFYGNYAINDWTITHRHAEHIVTALKDHKAILAWDIKNEPDLDFKSRGKKNVLGWLEQMTINIKEWDENHLVTIGWSNPEAATNLSKQVDFVSFHYYKSPTEFAEAYTNLKKAVPNKVIVLQEYGYSSYGGIWNGFLGSQEKQANYYTKMQKAIHKEKLPFILWTLYDFKEIPTSVVGRLPWRKVRQKYFGLIDINNQPKDAYEELIKNQ